MDRVEQAIGVFTLLWGGTNTSTPVHLGEVYTVFKRRVSGCDRVSVLLSESGEALPVPVNTSACANVTAASSDADTVYVADSSTGRIYKLADAAGPPSAGAGGSPNYYWSELAATPGTDVSIILPSSITVFWQDSTGIGRVAKIGGPVTLVAAVGRTLLGVAAVGYLLTERSVSGGFELARLDPTGKTEIRLGMHTASFAQGFRIDNSHAYWTENQAPSGSSYLRRIYLGGGAVEAVKVSSVVTYHTPASNGSALYWIEKRLDDGSMTLGRKNLGNGNQVFAPFPFVSVSALRPFPTSMGFICQTQSSPARYALYGGDL